MDIKNSVALVTGANRGLGLAFAQALLERGARKVYAAARDPGSIKLPSVVPLRLDVTKHEQIDAVAREARDVSLLVNNAGISRRSRLLEDSVFEAARDEFETNSLGLLAMSRAFAPVLATNGGGAILNVLSVLSWMAFPTSPTYSASKAAAWAFTNALRHQLRSQKTQVAALHVGYIETDMTEGVEAPKSNPADIVRITLDALEAGQEEILADEISRTVKQGLSADPGIYLGSPR
jgi:NAD(P)-dependent dehydrogenase (short-subunit alcohol dehydrogenase family)